jgi:hypothetical protein
MKWHTMEAARYARTLQKEHGLTDEQAARMFSTSVSSYRSKIEALDLILEYRAAHGDYNKSVWTKMCKYVKGPAVALSNRGASDREKEQCKEFFFKMVSDGHITDCYHIEQFIRFWDDPEAKDLLESHDSKAAIEVIGGGEVPHTRVVAEKRLIAKFSNLVNALTNGSFSGTRAFRKDVIASIHDIQDKVTALLLKEDEDEDEESA